MRIDIEDILKMQKQRKEWNSQDFRTLEFYENGEKIKVDESIIEDFIYCGLNNIDFILYGYYLKENQNGN